MQNINCHVKNTNLDERVQKPTRTASRDDKGKELSSLGYALTDPVNWMRVQLPKKQDLFQEFFRRIHNYMYGYVRLN